MSLTCSDRGSDLHIQDGELDLQLAADGDVIVEGVAYNGDLMQAGWGYVVGVELPGIEASGEVPLLVNHDNRVGSRVGVISASTADGKLQVNGKLTSNSYIANEVRRQMEADAKWQLSIGAQVVEEQFIREDDTATVNGVEQTGPFYHVTKAILREVSVVPAGADNKTSLQIAANFQTGGRDMDDDEVKDLEAQEAVAETDSDAVETTTENKPDVTADADTDIQAYREQQAAETARIATIRGLCGGMHDEIEATAIKDGWDATRTELEVLRAARPKAPAVHSHQDEVGAKTVEAAALLNHCDENKLLKSYGEKTLDAATALHLSSLRELIELGAGQRLPRFASGNKDWLRAAFSTMSLPGILSSVANKMLLDGYNYTEQTWRKVAKIASVNDFKTHNRYRLTSDMLFEKVGPGGELQHGEANDISYTNKADTYGKMFAINRQMLVNDDLGAFLEIPKQIGIGAGDAINHAFWTLVLSNPGTMFATGNNNRPDTDVVLGSAGLETMEQLFLDQTKPNGTPLGIEPKILLVPTALKTTALELMQSSTIAFTGSTDATFPQKNVYEGRYDVAVSAYLGNSNYSNYSSTAWYLLADPNRIAAFEVAFLNGQDRPTVEQAEADFNTLGIQFRGYIDFGVKQQDYRGGVWTDGTP